MSFLQSTCDETSANFEHLSGSTAEKIEKNSSNFKKFQPPLDAPIFYPSVDEFQDSLNYINKIKPVAEKYGICKIVPPKGWQPPFALNVDKLKFRPRVQKINELDALSRIKLNFIDLLIKFWDLQGTPISKPMIDSNKSLDLYTLHKLVHQEGAGGYDEVNKKNLWPLICEKLEYVNKISASALKNIYKSILYPYDIYVSKNSELDFKMQKSSNNVRKYKSKKHVTRRLFKDINEESNQLKIGMKKNENEYLIKDENSNSTSAVTNINSVKSENGDAKKEIKELKRLQSFGPGSESNIRTTKRESKSPKKVFNSVNSYNCLVCNKEDKEDFLIICVKCNGNCHTYCLKPALKEIPRGDWHCPTCLASEIRKVSAVYGFETSNQEYTLQQFGEMADLFKCQYFRMQVHKISNATVEEEFWKIVSDIDEKVVVEYGADLHSMDHGSGFPLKSATHLPIDEQYYANSSWNLNNLPILEGSVLGHINADISGMKIPWMYVGMCFSTFCWHNEDHWSYSINYLHWGEAKTWYGVPGEMAEKFEKCIRNIVPELFEAQEDLLHQLVTIINPNLISDQNISVYRLDQQAGEFVITFPRSYHAGFNQGYNFAEAVNFAPPDWIKIGRECITHYAELRRFCVFSHDELICKMALSVNDLSYFLLESLLKDLVSMIESERDYRKNLLDQGVNLAERVYFELIPDNERMCKECKTTCFLSAIKCKCSPQKLCCLKDFRKLCTCGSFNFILCYRYTMDELPRMISAINNRLTQYQRWLKDAEDALNPRYHEHENYYDKKNLHFFQKLVDEVKFWKDPKPEPLYAIKKIIQIAECCIDVIKQLQMTTVTKSVTLKSTTTTTISITSENSIPPLDLKPIVLSSLESLTSNDNDEMSEKLSDNSSSRTNKQIFAQNNFSITPDFSEKKLTYDELISFIEEIDNLPCFIDEKLILNELFDDVQYFRKCEIQLYKKTFDDLDLKYVEDLVIQSQKLCIQCPNIEEFYTKFKLHVWSMKLNQFNNNPNSLKLDDYQELLLLKQKINEEIIEKDIQSIDIIEKTITSGIEWEKKAEIFLNDSKRTFERLISLLESAQNIKATLKFEDELLNYYKTCDSWRNKIDEIYSQPYYPFCDLIHNMYVKGCHLPVAFKELTYMKCALKDCHNWRLELRRYFLHSTNSKYDIFERLIPKVNYSLKYFKKKSSNNQVINASFSPVIDNVKFGDLTPTNDIVLMLKSRGKRGYQYYRRIQELNIEKFLFKKTTEKFCYCFRKIDGLMIMCNLCKEWFHSTCIEMPKKYTYHTLNDSIDEELFSITDKFLCSNCKRTQQPFLDDVVPLMEKLENLQIRIPESELLHYLVDRAVEWREKVQKFFRLPEIVFWKSQCQSYLKQYISDMNECVRNSNKANQNQNPNQNYYKILSNESHPDDFQNNLCNFEIDLCDDLKMYLEKLIFSGDLMEFRTNETFQLWFLWQSIQKEDDMPSLIVFDEIVKTNRKKVQVENMSTAVEKDSKSTKKRYRQKKTTTKMHKKRSQSGQDQNSSSSSGDESCAADECIDPPDTKINWVQCDGGCDQWFHMHCIGLTPEDVNEDEDYVCRRCRRK